MARFIFGERKLEEGETFNKLVFFLVIGVIGAVMLVVGFIWINQTSNFLDRCLETTGVVIQLNWEYDDEGAAHAYPLLQFVNQKTGEEITVQGSSGSYPPEYQVGQEVDVLYDPENPYDAKIQSFSEIWGGPLILSGLGGIFLSVGLIKFGLGVRARKQFAPS